MNKQGEMSMDPFRSILLSNNSPSQSTGDKLANGVL